MAKPCCLCDINIEHDQELKEFYEALKIEEKKLRKRQCLILIVLITITVSILFAIGVLP